MREFPGKIKDILRRHHEGGIGPEDCQRCSSWCCNFSGFAILDNVKLIYEAYREGRINGEDFAFTQGLSFDKFVSEYFDVVIDEASVFGEPKELVLYFPRCVDADGKLIRVQSNDSSYLETRRDLFLANPGMSRGCVFLKVRTPSWPDDDRNLSRKCMLHSKESGSHVTMKPIHCVFHTCNSVGDIKVADDEIGEDWYNTIVECF
jgi:hypothetical protein